MFRDKWYVFDAEGDGLTPSKFYCLCLQGKEEAKALTDYGEMREFLLNAEYLIGHNISRWDIPQLERVLGIKIKAKLIDTLALSWYLEPKRPRHNLESYGDDFKIQKPFIANWFELDLEAYIHRCTEDVKINTALWKYQYKRLLDIYGSEKSLLRLVDYLAFKMSCARRQEKYGWKLDIENARAGLEKLKAERDHKINELKAAMPSIPLFTKRTKPKQLFNKFGDYTKRGRDYIDLAIERGFDELPEEIEIQTGEEEPNPRSIPQIKSWLFELGWVPETFKYIKDKETKETRQVPQISKEMTKEICPSIVKLYTKEPRLELLEGLAVLGHRIGLLEGFLNNVNDKGYLVAGIQGLTNTLRFQHAIIVNLPRVGRPYADEIRASLICEDDEILVGADMSSLEDRLKQHFLYPHDRKYVESMMKDDFDPHLDLAILAGALTPEQVQAYKDGDKTHKSVRDNYKTTNYALI